MLTKEASSYVNSVLLEASQPHLSHDRHAFHTPDASFVSMTKPAFGGDTEINHYIWVYLATTRRLEAAGSPFTISV
jgi:hypothetical protein